MLNFPRIQFFTITLVVFLLLIFVIKKWKWHDYAISLALLSALIIHIYFIISYTSIISVEVPWAEESSAEDTELSIIVANVKMKNRESKLLIDLIEENDPDLILAMEVDKWWDEQLSVLEQEYPYSQHTINEVAYGMVLFSKLPIKELEVEYLNNKNVPSFDAIILGDNDKEIRLHAMHPVPPTHFEKLPDNEGQQETALQQLGRKVNDRVLPTIVAGDLNDVIWADIDRLTGTEGILLDARIGRGFYSSFNAENIFMRWPLDHVFVTKEFKIAKLERLSKIGSDHFPILVELVL